MSRYATTPPLCDLCDPPRRHWKGDPHQFKKSDPVAEEVVDRAKGAVEGQGVPVEAAPVRREAKSGGARSQAAERTAPRHNRKPAAPATAKAEPPASSQDAMPQPPGTKFDRTAYQRDYMRDKRQADKVGLTVAQWRAKQKEAEK